LNRQPVDIAEAIRQVVALSDVSAAARQITISTEPVWVEWDVVRLQQVLTNLVTNAIKYTPADGQIRVALRAEDGDAVLSVEDTGFGIAPERLPFIFDMYVQVDRTLDHAQGGLGIGLALVRRLVELHGGTVVASSEGEGRGSAFTLRLRQIAAPGHSVAASFQERRATQRRVLLIEDSGHAREQLRMMLELAGHLVYDAPDVGRGLELMRTVSPDVGIIDVSSGMVDRRLVARRFRDDPHGRKMVLVSVGPPADPGGPPGPPGPPEDGFDFHFAEPVDVEHLARLLTDDAIQVHAANQ
jgi:anti-sigma regulatory factor (Ser/Thr protein kinase)/CheY-like chemotaxis protein